jgi:hypothetical protein
VSQSSSSEPSLREIDDKGAWASRTEIDDAAGDVERLLARLVAERLEMSVSQPFSATQPSRPERLFLPHSCRL